MEEKLKNVLEEEKSEETVELKAEEDEGIIKLEEESENEETVELNEEDMAELNYNNATNKPSINNVELKGNLTTEQLKLAYEKLLNLPKINGVELIGNKTTKDLGIEIPNESEIFDVSCTISLATMTVTNVSNFSKDIIAKRNEGYLVRMNCNFVENQKMNVVVILNIIDGNWTFFYPVIRGDIGEGMKNYVFRLGIGENNATIEAHDLSSSVDILTEFDIEYTYEDNQIYNANAIHQLMELFAWELMMIQEEVAQYNDRISALENKLGG